jgi:hypothetical protein
MLASNDILAEYLAPSFPRAGSSHPGKIIFKRYLALKQQEHK